MPSEAQAQKRRKKSRTQWISAQVVVDGAAVYSKPDFDSPVQDYLQYKTNLRVTSRSTAGVGGLGLFHRIRYGKKFGYVVDTDIRIAKNVRESVPEPLLEKQLSKAWDPEEAEARMNDMAPVFFRRYVGGALAIVNFTEKFSGRKLSDDMLMYGLRATGPGVLFDGPPLDVNFWFSFEAPKYYSNFTSSTPKGFLMFGDIMAMVPLVSLDEFMLTIGLGMMWTYTNYKVKVNDVAFDSQEIRLGADLGTGLGYRIDNFILRLDAKYYYEKTSYLGYIGSFQMEY